MRDQSIHAHPELERLLVTAPPSSVRLFEEAAVEILTVPVTSDLEFDDARTRFHRALERLAPTDRRLVHELEAAFNSAYGAAASAVARAWLRDLGWIVREVDEQ